MQKAVSHDGVDLVIGTLGSTPDNYEIVPLCQKDQLLVVPKQIMRELAGENYELVRAEFAEGADLSYFESAPFIKIPRQSSGGRALANYLKYYDINPQFICELTNIENAFQLANGGLGVFIYSKLFWDMLAPELQRDYMRNIDIFQRRTCPTRRASAHITIGRPVCTARPRSCSIPSSGSLRIISAASCGIIEYDATPRREALAAGSFLPAGLKMLTRAAVFGTLDVRDNGDDKAVWSATGEER